MQSSKTVPILHCKPQRALVGLDWHFKIDHKLGPDYPIILPVKFYTIISVGNIWAVLG